MDDLALFSQTANNSYTFWGKGPNSLLIDLTLIKTKGLETTDLIFTNVSSFMILYVNFYKILIWKTSIAVKCSGVEVQSSSMVNQRTRMYLATSHHWFGWHY